jgi:hypothetical protein
MTTYAVYHQFRELDSDPNCLDRGQPHGSFEVFYADAQHGRQLPAGESPTLLGWYWQACFPGCLPDGEAVGPFDTALEAYADAMGDAYESTLSAVAREMGEG